MFQLLWAVFGTIGITGVGNLKVSLSILIVAMTAQSAVLAVHGMREGSARPDILCAMVPGVVACVFLGTWALVRMNPDLLKRVMGCIFLALAVYQCLKLSRAYVHRARFGPTQANTPVTTSKHGDTEVDQQALVTTHPVECDDQDSELLPAAHDDMLTEVVNDLNELEEELIVNVYLKEGARELPHVRGAELTDDMSTASEDSNEKDDGMRGQDPNGALARVAEAVEEGKVKEETKPPPVVRMTCTKFFTTPIYPLGFLAGCTSGFMAGAFGTGGPPMMVYFSFMPSLGKSEIRTIPMMSALIRSPISIISGVVFGVFQLELWLHYVLGVAGVLAGAWMGNALHTRVDRAAVVLCLQLFLFLSSVALTNPGTDSVPGLVLLVIYIVCGVFLVFLVIITRYQTASAKKKRLAVSPVPAVFTPISLDAEKENLCGHEGSTSIPLAVEGKDFEGVSSTSTANSIPVEDKDTVSTSTPTAPNPPC